MFSKLIFALKAQSMLAHNFRDGPFVNSSPGSFFFSGFPTPQSLEDSQSVSSGIPSPNFFSRDDQMSGNLGLQALHQPPNIQMQHPVHQVGIVGVGSEVVNSAHNSPVKSPVQYNNYDHQQLQHIQHSNQADTRNRPSKS